MKRLLIVLMLLATPLAAVQPDEVLQDPTQEARARELSKELRCLVCRNESIDESNAGLARDLRLLVRERIVAGDSDDEALDFITARYGEYVLLRPTVTGGNMVLYAAGPVLFLIALILGALYIRRRGQAPETAGQSLSAEEEARLKRLLDD